MRIEFLAAVDETMERMVRLAKHLGSPPGIDPTLGIKRVFVKRFPFSGRGLSVEEARSIVASGAADDDR